VDAQPVASSTPLAGGHLLAAVSTSVVGILRDHYGRGPMKAKTYALDDIVVRHTRQWLHGALGLRAVGAVRGWPTQGAAGERVEALGHDAPWTPARDTWKPSR